jgi:hypothetical protein
MEDRVNWCVRFSLVNVMYKDVSKEMKTNVILEFMSIHCIDAFIDYYMTEYMNSLIFLVVEFML